MEKLDQIRYDGWELIIEVTGGGVAELIPRGLGADKVAAQLRRIAAHLERSVEERAAKRHEGTHND